MEAQPLMDSQFAIFSPAATPATQTTGAIFWSLDSHQAGIERNKFQLPSASLTLLWKIVHL